MGSIITDGKKADGSDAVPNWVSAAVGPANSTTSATSETPSNTTTTASAAVTSTQTETATSTSTTTTGTTTTLEVSNASAEENARKSESAPVNKSSNATPHQESISTADA